MAPDSGDLDLGCNFEGTRCTCSSDQQCGGVWPICENLDAGDFGPPRCGCDRDEQCGDAGLRCLSPDPASPINDSVCAFPCTDPRLASCATANPATPICDPVGGACQPCSEDLDCHLKQSEGGPVCRKDGSCGCRADGGGCPAGELCAGPFSLALDFSLAGTCVAPVKCAPSLCAEVGGFCDWNTGVCSITSCLSDYDCSSYAGAAGDDLCDLAYGLCVECLNWGPGLQRRSPWSALATPIRKTFLAPCSCLSTAECPKPARRAIPCSTQTWSLDAATAAPAMRTARQVTSAILARSAGRAAMKATAARDRIRSAMLTISSDRTGEIRLESRQESPGATRACTEPIALGTSAVAPTPGSPVGPVAWTPIAAPERCAWMAELASRSATLAAALAGRPATSRTRSGTAQDSATRVSVPRTVRRARAATDRATPAGPAKVQTLSRWLLRLSASATSVRTTGAGSLSTLKPASASRAATSCRAPPASSALCCRR